MTPVLGRGTCRYHFVWLLCVCPSVCQVVTLYWSFPYFHAWYQASVQYIPSIVVLLFCAVLIVCSYTSQAQMYKRNQSLIWVMLVYKEIDFQGGCIRQFLWRALFVDIETLSPPWQCTTLVLPRSCHGHQARFTSYWQFIKFIEPLNMFWCEMIVNVWLYFRLTPGHFTSL